MARELMIVEEKPPVQIRLLEWFRHKAPWSHRDIARASIWRLDSGRALVAWTPTEIKAMRAEKVPFRCHSFEAACADLDIEHRLAKPRHPWTNGQVERMNRTIKGCSGHRRRS